MKKTICCILLAAMAGMCSCKNSGEMYTSAPDVQIRYISSTQNVTKNQTEFSGVEKNALSFFGVKNEYESAQIVITAKDDVKNWDLRTENLKNANGKEISRECFEAYREHYVEIAYTQNAASPYGAGEYADALIPIDLARKANELHIEKGNNQGVWITVKIPVDAEEGEYAGNFTLTVGGKEIPIPVRLTVCDAVLSDSSSAKSLFLMNSEYTLTYGELDSGKEMMLTYYDFLLDYRINAYNIPIETVEDISAFVDAVKQYYDHPKVTNYGLPNNSKGSGGVFDNALAKRQILALAEASTTGKNYLSKLVIKNGDETDYVDTLTDGTWEASLAKNKNLRLQMKAAAEEIRVNRFEKYNGYISNFESAEAAAEAVENLPIVDPLCYASTFLTAYNDNEESPLSREGEYLKYVNVWCPKSEILADEYRDRVFEAAERYNAEVWWYTANNPTWPTPTYHIDTNPVAARAMSWMQKAYRIQGNLYWGVCYGGKVNDVYSDTATKSPAGDGYLLYPGAKYGNNGPLPSIRLMRIRDGLEDYELLCDLEKKYETFAAENGIADLNVDSVLSAMYDRIFESCAVYDDSETFEETAEELRRALSEKTRVFCAAIHADESSVEAIFYADESVKIEDAESTGKTATGLIGYHYKAKRTAAPIYVDIKAEGKLNRKFLCRGIIGTECGKILPDSTNSSCSENAGIEIAKDGIAMSFCGKEGDLTFEPFVNLKTTLFGAESWNTKDDLVLKITIHNASDEDIGEMKLWLYDESGARKEAGNYYLLRGKDTTLCIRTDLLGKKYNQITELRFLLKNSDKEHKLLIKNVRFESL